MKIKDNFLLKEIAGNYVVVPVGNELIDLNCMITLNESGAFLWEKLSGDISLDDLLGEMLKEYDVDKETALADIGEFLDSIRKIGALDE